MWRCSGASRRLKVSRIEDWIAREQEIYEIIIIISTNGNIISSYAKLVSKNQLVCWLAEIFVKPCDTRVNMSSMKLTKTYVRMDCSFPSCPNQFFFVYLLGIKPCFSNSSLGVGLVAVHGRPWLGSDNSCKHTWIRLTSVQDTAVQSLLWAHALIK